MYFHQEEEQCSCFCRDQEECPLTSSSLIRFRNLPDYGRVLIAYLDLLLHGSVHNAKSFAREVIIGKCSNAPVLVCNRDVKARTVFIHSLGLCFTAIDFVLYVKLNCLKGLLLPSVILQLASLVFYCNVSAMFFCKQHSWGKVITVWWEHHGANNCSDSHFSFHFVDVGWVVQKLCHCFMKTM